MIDFRYHIVSIVAIFLALAVGVALGAGPLEGTFNEQLASQAETDREDKERLRAQVEDLTQVDEYQAAFVSTVAPELVGERLAGRQVVVVALPGAADTDIEAVRSLLGEAGAGVSPTVRISQTLVNDADRALVDEVTSQLLARLPEVSVGENSTPYERAGQVIARGFLTDEDSGAPVDAAAQDVLATYSDVNLIATEAPTEQLASLVVVVAGDPPADAADTQAQVSATLAQAFDAASDGVVVAGRPPSAEENGVVASIRDTDGVVASVSSVDVVDTPSGRVSTVFALLEQAAGSAGHYGLVGAADGAVPTLAEEE